MKRALIALITALGGMPALLQASARASGLPVRPDPAGRVGMAVVSGAPRALPPIAPAAQDRIREAFNGLPLSFEANAGQEDHRVRFVARGDGYRLFLTRQEAVLALVSGLPEREGGSRLGAAAAGRRTRLPRPATGRSVATVRIKLVGADQGATVGLDPLPGRVNYLLGKGPAQWHAGIRRYARVRYAAVYPGIDLIYYGNQRQLEYDFQLAPGADPRRIRLAFAGVRRLALDGRGNLVLHTAAGRLYQHKPRLYQEVDGVRRRVEGAYRLLGRGEVGFRVGAYDTSRPLVIDPVLAYSSFLGGKPTFSRGVQLPGGDDCAYGIALDDAGYAYIVGQTVTINFPTTPGAYQPQFTGVQPPNRHPSPSVFVAKFDLSASGPASLIYSTYLHTAPDWTYGPAGYGIAVDGAGNAFLTGAENGVSFVTKLNASGDAIVYSTILPGAVATGIALDSAGAAYLTGFVPTNYQRVFPTTPSAFQRLPAGRQDAFVAKFDPAGGLVYSTYLGGGDDENLGDPGSTGYRHGSIAVDSAGNAYVTGYTSSEDFPTTPGAYRTAFIGGTPGGAWTDAFVAKLNPTGSALVYSTYLGGKTDDFGYGIAVDAAGCAHVTGTAANPRCFVWKLDARGSRLLYNVTLPNCETRAIALDASGNAWVAGRSYPGFDARDPIQAIQSQGDAFVAGFSPSGGRLFATFHGGKYDDIAYGVAVDNHGSVYLAGRTVCANFPLRNAFQTTGGGPSGPSSSGDAFVVKIAEVNRADLTPPTVTATPSPVPNAAGWNKGTVTVTLRATDNPGGRGVSRIVYSITGAVVDGATTITGDTGAVVLSVEGQSTISYTAFDNAGNPSAPRTLTVAIDKTAPVVKFGTPKPFPTAAGWNKTDVTIPFTVTDGGAGVATVDPATGVVTVAGEGRGVTGTVTVTDRAGNTATVRSPAVNIDRTPPTIQLGAPSPAPNAAGWHRTDVSVPFTADDSLSGVASQVPATGPLLLTRESAHAVGVVVATDRAGNRTILTSPPVAIDKTPPTILYQGNAGLYHPGDMVDISCKATDGISHIASHTARGIRGPATSFPLGVNTFSATATDQAGNVASATTQFTVEGNAPPAPSGLAVSAPAFTTLALIWTDNSPNETGFAIERRTANSSFQPLATVAPNTQSYTDTGLLGGTLYAYRVRALGSGTPSPYGSEASATTLPVNIATLGISPSSVRGGTSATATLTLDGPAPTGGVVCSVGNDSPAVATVAENVTVPAGAQSVTFTVATKAVSQATTVRLEVRYGIRYGLEGKSATLTVTPP